MAGERALHHRSQAARGDAVSEPSGLTKKLCEIGKSLTWMKKRGRFQSQAYGFNYATEADLVLAIRNEMFDRNVFLIPNVTDMKRESWTDDKNRRRSITDVTIEWTWIDGDTGETRISHMTGSGEDSGDKGIYKAVTGSEKYLLLKTFLIPTFDDAEAMEPADKRELQKRVGIEKTAALKAQRDAREAHSEEEAQKVLRKGEVMFLTLPDRFHGEFAAVFGKPTQREVMIQFFNDCNAQRFKAQEGIIYKLPIQYAQDCKTLAEREGFSVEDKTGDADRT
jgi:hypothetical protein